MKELPFEKRQIIHRIIQLIHFYMRADQCISVTELSKNTSGVIRRASNVGTQYVFVNNKPQAVILSMAEYEALESRSVEFGTVLYSELSPETKTMYDQAKKQPKISFVDF